jgi:hypothetical protein
VNERVMMNEPMDCCGIAVEVAMRCASYFVRTNIPAGWEIVQQEFMAPVVPMVHPMAPPSSPDVSAVADQGVSNDTIAEAVREESVAPNGDGIATPTGMDLFPGSG